MKIRVIIHPAEEGSYTADGVEFILAEINKFDAEIELTRQNKELMAFLADRAKQTKTFSAAEVRARLGLTSD